MNSRLRNGLIAAGLGGLVLWAYWTVVRDMAERWSDDPQYSHGYLVPLFSAFLLWYRRQEIRDAVLTPSWWGVALAAAGISLWAAGTYLFLSWFSAISLLLCLAGLAVVVGGWPMLRWSWQPILFLGFMAPLPYRFQTALGGALQQLATKMSTYILQVFGVAAISEGNVILINDVRIGIVEACSGLGMLVTFFALSAAVALLMRDSERWLRLVIVVSAAPVAVFANVARISVTGYLYSISQEHLAKVVFHDVAGWLMMPLAVVMLLAEIHVLKRLVIDRPANGDGSSPSVWIPGLKRGTTPSSVAARKRAKRR
jgi:exosortase